MSKSLLVTRPNHDHTTNYLYYWSALVIREAKKKGFSIYDLSGKKANKKVFDSYLKSKNPGIIFLNGHGNEDTIMGYDNKPLLESGKTQFVDKSIIYARSCDAGSILGQYLVKNGLKAFIGYTRKFIFAYTPSKTTKPLQDSLARLFLEPSNLIVTTIIKGHSVFTADQRSKNAMFVNFRSMISTSATYEERFAARWLWGNIKSQVVLGDGNASGFALNDKHH